MSFLTPLVKFPVIICKSQTPHLKINCTGKEVISIPNDDLVKRGLEILQGDEKNMSMKKNHYKWLTLAITASLLSGLTNIAGAAPIQSNKMVKVGNNQSDSATPYNLIAVTQDSADSSFVVGGGETAFIGIGQNTGTPLVVYVTNPTSGLYNVTVSNDGSQTTGKVEAVGAGSMAAGAVTIFGPLAIKVDATGTTGTSGDATAVGMGVGDQATSVVTGNTILSVTAQGGTSTTSAKAKAQGVTVGNDNPVSNIELGTATGTNTINVTAKGGLATATGGGGGTNVSASAYGAENYNVVTFKGDTYINATAEGGTPASGGSYLAGSATADAYGIYNGGGTVKADKLVIGTARATGGRGVSVDGSAYGILNQNNGSVTTGALSLESVSAQGGIANSSFLATATATGVANETGTVITDTFSVKTAALGGTSDSGATATAIGLLSGKNSGDDATLTMGNGTGTNEIYVMASGGISTATNTNNSFTGTAFGLLNNNSTSIIGTTTLDVEAFGGNKAPANVSLGEAYAMAYGIYNQGSNLITGNLEFTKVQATANTGLEAHAEAYGIYNAASGVTLNFGNINMGDVSAYGGNSGSIPNSTADATAYALQNLNTTGKITADTIAGTVTAEAGSGESTANAVAIGLNNKGTLEAKAINLTVTGTAGSAEEKATSETAGLSNNGTLIITSGTNSLNVTANGGKSTGIAGQVSATAYGLHTRDTLTINDQLNLNVQATGGSADAAVAGSQAVTAWAQAYGLYNSTGTVTAAKMAVEQIKATAGAGLEAQALAVGLANDTTTSMTTTSVDIANVEANGGTGTKYAFARAAGITNSAGTFSTTDTGATNTISVVARGGTISGSGSAQEDAYGQAYGIVNLDTMSIKGSTVINATATGGNGTAHNTYALAMGIRNKSASVLNIDGPLTITSEATSIAAGSSDASADATGVANFGGTTNLKDDVTIIAKASGVSGSSFAAGSLYAEGGTLNAGTDGTSSLGKVVKLEGDVLADKSGTQINLTLDQPASYLQGNVKELNDGIVNLVVGNGATWKPVYDNRNGSFFDKNDSATFTKDYVVDANSITRLTLADGGIVDLTWDDATRNPSTDSRSLTISRLAGNNGTFKINSDLAHNVADKISVVGADVATTTENIQVAYDPYLANTGLAKGSTLKGKAEVVSTAPDTLTFTGKDGEYNLYKYTPTLVKDADGKWYLTSLVINNGSSSTGPVKTIAQAGLGLQELWLSETNNLEKRLGELRTRPAEAGVWARYNHGKLEHNDVSVKYNLFQAGYDKESIGTHENTYRGLAVSHIKGDGSYEIGSGDLSSTTLSLYQTGIRSGGQYYDVVLRAGRYANDYDLVSEGGNKASADYHTWGYSISGEYGMRKQLGRGFYVEPQAELILGRIQSADYVTSTNMNAHVDAQNKALTRIGIVAGKEFKGGNLYGKANYYHDFSGGVHIKAADGSNSILYNEDVAHNWCELALGGTVKTGKNSTIYGELSKNLGQLTSGLQINLGARWQF